MIKYKMFEVGEVYIFEEEFEVIIWYFVVGEVHSLKEAGGEREFKGRCDIISG
jgi:hypothetical protein